jgi:hypothetical protein
VTRHRVLFLGTHDAARSQMAEGGNATLSDLTGAVFYDTSVTGTRT